MPKLIKSKYIAMTMSLCEWEAIFWSMQFYFQKLIIYYDWNNIFVHYWVTKSSQTKKKYAHSFYFYLFYSISNLINFISFFKLNFIASNFQFVCFLLLLFVCMTLIGKWDYRTIFISILFCVISSLSIFMFHSAVLVLCFLVRYNFLYLFVCMLEIIRFRQAELFFCSSTNVWEIKISD